jgi:hypothetical protein
MLLSFVICSLSVPLVIRKNLMCRPSGLPPGKTHRFPFSILGANHLDRLSRVSKLRAKRWNSCKMPFLPRFAAQSGHKSNSLTSRRAGYGSSGLFLLVLVISLLPATAPAVITLAELKNEPGMTPEKFIRHFADFGFELRREVQQPEAFLNNQAGDCDDFATLAADLLRQRGYTTRLVAVFMPHDVHVVCYVEQTGVYLDFNRRGLASPLMECDRSLSAIAASVAASFRAPWRSVSEFTFHDGMRDFITTEFR